MVCWSSQYPIVWYGSIYLFGRWLLESYPSTAAYCWTSMWLHLTAPDFEGRLQWADFAADGPQQSIVVCSFNPFQKTLPMRLHIMIHQSSYRWKTWLKHVETITRILSVFKLLNSNASRIRTHGILSSFKRVWFSAQALVSLAVVACNYWICMGSNFRTHLFHHFQTIFRSFHLDICQTHFDFSATLK